MLTLPAYLQTCSNANKGAKQNKIAHALVLVQETCQASQSRVVLYHRPAPWRPSIFKPFTWPLKASKPIDWLEHTTPNHTFQASSCTFCTFTCLVPCLPSVCLSRSSSPLLPPGRTYWVQCTHAFSPLLHVRHLTIYRFYDRFYSLLSIPRFRGENQTRNRATTFASASTASCCRGEPPAGTTRSSSTRRTTASVPGPRLSRLTRLSLRCGAVRCDAATPSNREIVGVALVVKDLAPGSSPCVYCMYARAQS